MKKLAKKTTIKRLFSTIIIVIFFLGCGARHRVHIPQDLLERKRHSASVEIGASTTAALLQTNVILIAPDMQVELQNLADELAEVSQCDVRPRVHLINSPMINLYATGGGDIIVFSGFLDAIHNRDELAFGLGHELAHICLNHTMQSMEHAAYINRTGGRWATIIVSAVVSGATAGVSGVLGNLATIGTFQPILDATGLRSVSIMASRLISKVSIKIANFVLVSSIHYYSQENETQADEHGLEYMRNAGYDPQAAASVIEVLDQSRGKFY